VEVAAGELTFAGVLVSGDMDYVFIGIMVTGVVV